jgi:hypothetical protein
MRQRKHLLQDLERLGEGRVGYNPVHSTDVRVLKWPGNVQRKVGVHLRVDVIGGEETATPFPERLNQMAPPNAWL